MASMVALASVADSRLFDPRVGDDKAYITTMACNRHLSIVELSPATREAGQTEPGILLHLRQGLPLGFGYVQFGYYYLNGTPPCAASSTWTWVNQLLTLVQ